MESVIQRLRERQISVQTALEQMTQHAESTVKAKDEQASSDLDGKEFALFWVLKGQNVAQPKETAQRVNQVLADHPGWAYNSEIESRMRLKLYAALKSQVRPGAAGTVLKDEAGPLSQKTNRAATLKATVDALLKMRKVVTE